MNHLGQQDEGLKGQVREFWDKESCGVSHTNQNKHTLEYFEEIEEVRYKMESYIPSFAQFTRAHGKSVLEVGVGAGTDFIQWVRAGAIATGIDLTNEAIENTKKRLALYGLKAAELRQADCENLPFADNTFDVVYSMGVIHHTPNTPKALDEICRVTKPGGEFKIMIYNRHSVCAYMNWFMRCFLRGNPFRSLKWSLFHHMESPGTKAYTISEVKQMMSKHTDFQIVDLNTILTYHDYSSRFMILRFVRSCLCAVLGNRFGWYLNLHARKKK